MSPNLWLIFGEEEYLVSAKAQETVNGLVPLEDRVFGLEMIDGRADSMDMAADALSRCSAALKTVGFFLSRKVVWLRDVNFLADAARGKGEAVKPRLDDLTAMVKRGFDSGQALVVSAGKVDKRLGFYKACLEAGEVVEFAVPERDHEIDAYVNQRMDELTRKFGLRLSEDAVHAFRERVSPDVRQMAGEFEKLDLYLGVRREVTADDVRALTSVSRATAAWDLADAVGHRQLDRAVAILRQLLFQKESHIGLIIGIEKRLRDLMILREALDHGWLKETGSYRGRLQFAWRALPAEIEARFGKDMEKDPRATHPFRVGILATQAGKFSRRQLQANLKAAVEAHEALLTGSPPALTLELLLVRMLASAKPIAR